MRPRALLFLTAVSVAAVGCVQTYWTKPDFNQADWNRDTYECERDMRQSGYYGGGVLGEINAQNFFERCLAAKGYSKQIVSTQSSTPPSPRASNLAEMEMHIGEEVPEDRRDPHCIYSADGVLVACPKW